jgi:hypothetical protein
VGSSQCAGFKFQFNLLRDAIGHFLCACCCRPPGALRVAVLGALRSPGEFGFNTAKVAPGGVAWRVAKSPPRRSTVGVSARCAVF